MTKELEELARYLNIGESKTITVDDVIRGIQTAAADSFSHGFDAGKCKANDGMAPGEYRQAVLFTESIDFDAVLKRLSDPRILRLLHGGYGMATEASELLDATKKHIFYGTPLDEVNIKEEVGDSDWYREIILDAFGWTDAEVKRANIEKLKKRYPNGFNREDADNRDLSAERAALEGKGDEAKEEKDG